MNDQDRNAIASVFNRVREIEQQGRHRDSDAEHFIQQEMQKNPGSAYYLAQTVLVQQEALRKAQERIQALEKSSLASVPASPAPLASNAFGRRPAAAANPSQTGLSAAGFGRSNAGSSGGGFMAGALQTAMGVAGGMMLGNMLSSFFGGNEAQASEAPIGEEAAFDYSNEGQDYSEDDGGDF